MSGGRGHPLFGLLSRLESDRIHFALARNRPDSVLVTLTLFGERVEVDVFEDGHMEVSRFRGDESVEGGEELIDRLLAQAQDD